MKTIQRRLCLYAGACILLTAAAIVISIRTVDYGQTGLLWMPFLLLTAISTASLTVKETGKLRTARLISDNQILQIFNVVYKIQDKEKDSDCQPIKSAEAFVSCFGILLDSEIIKFNQDKIRLKAIVIGQDVLSFDYGTVGSNHNIILFYDTANGGNSEYVAERFRYETGIVPSINQECQKSLREVREFGFYRKRPRLNQAPGKKE